MLREGNSDRRVAGPVKAYAKKNPHTMGSWSRASRSHVAHMTKGNPLYDLVNYDQRIKIVNFKTFICSTLSCRLILYDIIGLIVNIISDCFFISNDYLLLN